MSRYRVLIVDDSAFARKVLRETLEADERLEIVGIARDGLDALEKIGELKPDVVTLDLQMPVLDGVGVLRALQATANSAPRVVIVTMTDAENALAVDALATGAFDVVYKPTALATDRLYELGKELVEKVVLAARSPTPNPPPRGAAAKRHARTNHARVVVIGASTGGPRALTYVLSALPADFPAPIAAVVHMPVGYTEAFAARLDVASKLRVREAASGVVLEAGTALLARAGAHLRVRAGATGLTSWLEERTDHDDSQHCPSVDALFASAAQHVGSGVLGVVMTGMGTDGLAGSRAIHAAGGRLLVEAESSSVVYGMPRAVAEAKLGAEEVTLELMAQAIVDRV
jgi:two-component system chemotaxis response regulator CheB